MFELSSEITIHNVEEVKNKIENILIKNNKEKIYFDGANIEDIDAAGLQLLLSLKKTKDINIKNKNDFLNEVLKLTGTFRLFEGGETDE